MTTQKPGISADIAFICLAIFFADASHSTVIPIFPGFAQELGASLSILGSYGSVAALTMLLVSLPLGRLSDKYGRKRMMLPGLALFIMVPVSYLYASSPFHLYPIRMLLGLAVGMIFSNGFLLMTENAQPEIRNMAQGMYMTSMGIGFTLGPLIGGYTAKYYGIHFSFLISAAFGAMSLLFLLMVSEKHTLAVDHKQSDNRISLISIIGDRKVLAAGIANFLNALMFNALTIFFPVYGDSVGFDESQIGTGFTSRGLASTIVRLPVGALTRQIKALYLMVTGLVLSSLMIFGVSSSKSLVIVSILMGVQGIAYGVYLTSGNVYITQQSDEDYRGTAMAVYSMFGNLSGIINPLILGLIAENMGIGGALVFSSAMTIVGVVLVYILASRSEKESK